MKYLLTLSLVMLVVAGGMAQDQTAAEFKNAGNAALKEENHKLALQNYEKAIAVWDEAEEMDAAMVYNAATCARKIDNYKTAQKYYTQARDLNYKGDVCTYYIAYSLNNLEKDEEMEKVLVAGIKEYSTSKYVKNMKKMLVTYYLKQSSEYYAEGQTILNTRADGNRDQWDAIKVKASVVFDKAAELAKEALKYDASNANANAIISGIDTFMKS